MVLPFILMAFGSLTDIFFSQDSFPLKRYIGCSVVSVLKIIYYIIYSLNDIFKIFFIEQNENKS